MTDILPCPNPKCTGECEAMSGRLGDRLKHGRIAGGGGSMLHWVACARCFMTGPIATDEAGAIDAWNKIPRGNDRAWLADELRAKGQLILSLQDKLAEKRRQLGARGVVIGELKRRLLQAGGDPVVILDNSLEAYPDTDVHTPPKPPEES